MGRNYGSPPPHANCPLLFILVQNPHIIGTHPKNFIPQKFPCTKASSTSSPPSQSHMMATLSRTAPQLDGLDHPTLSLVQLASLLSADVVLFAYYTSHVQHVVVQGIIQCLVSNKEELVDAGDDDDEEEEEYEEGDDDEGEEEGEGGEGGDEEEEDEEGGDEPPAKRRKKDDDEEKKKDDDEG